MNVLLVDDAASLRHRNREILKSLNITNVFEAEDGDVALEILKNNVFDLIILDINMPRLDGIKTLQKIRANDAHKDTQILMCTTETEKIKVIKAMAEGANNYLMKPFSSEDLKIKLDTLGFML